MMLDKAGRNLIGLGPLRDASPEKITRPLRPCFEALTGIPGRLCDSQDPPEAEA
jgi:hypothetical protein